MVCELENWFRQVWVISLKRRPERLANFRQEIEKAKWPFRRPEVFDAIEGDKVGIPKFWQTGGGSYGCLRSHLVILERAIMEDVESMLVLEDDAVFVKFFAEKVADFLARVPDDWECLMLGGQHVNSQPIPLAPGIVRTGGGGGIQRTHCYALRGQAAMKALYLTWANSAVHCDWVMGPCMAKFNTYAPEPFLVGQAKGQSDISGALNPAKFWRPPTGKEPVVVLHAPREVMEALREKGFHAGYSREPGTGIDTGLRDLFAEKKLTKEERNARLKDWINLIQWEVASMDPPAVCTIWHPKASAKEVRLLVNGKVVEITANTAEDALNKLPADIHAPLHAVIQVALLRASRKVLEALREQGWHNGYWRDEITGQDNGVRRLFAATRDKERLRAGLCEIVHVLHDEARKIPGGVATLWHDKIQAEMLASDGIQVFEIAAETANDAKRKWKELTNGKDA